MFTTKFIFPSKAEIYFKETSLLLTLSMIKYLYRPPLSCIRYSHQRNPKPKNSKQGRSYDIFLIIKFKVLFLLKQI